MKKFGVLGAVLMLGCVLSAGSAGAADYYYQPENPVEAVVMLPVAAVAGAAHVVAGAVSLVFWPVGILEPDNWSAHPTLSRAYQAHRAGDLQTAVNNYYEYLKGNPSDPAVNYNMASILQNSGNNSEAIPYYLNGLAGNPRHEGILINLSAAYYQTQQYAKSAEMAQRALAVNPSSSLAATNLDLARRAMSGQPQTAPATTGMTQSAPVTTSSAYPATQYNNANNPNYPYNYPYPASPLGVVGAVASLPAAAVVGAAHVVAGVASVVLWPTGILEPFDLNASPTLARAYQAHRAGDLRTAVNSYWEYLRTNPTDPIANYNLATILQNSGNYSEAITYYENGLAGNPRHEGILVNLSAAYYQTQQYARAAEMAQRALAVNPGNSQAATNLELARRAMTGPQTAPVTTQAPAPVSAPAIAMPQTTTAAPYTTSARPLPGGPLGLVAAVASIPFAAVASVTSLAFYPWIYEPVGVQPGSPLYLGYRAHRAGEQQNAVNYYWEYLQNDPYNPVANYNLANILYNNGNYAEAIAYYENGLRGEPRNEGLLLNLGAAYYQTNQYAKASEVWQRVLAVNPANTMAKANVELAQRAMNR